MEGKVNLHRAGVFGGPQNSQAIEVPGFLGLFNDQSQFVTSPK